MKEMLKKLAQARIARQRAKEAMSAMLAAVQQSQEYIAAQNAERLHAQMEAELTANIQEDAISAYKATGNKHPEDGVTIKVFTRLQYNPEEALAWAKTNAPFLVIESIDAKQFETLAKGGNVACVTIVDEPRAQIASKLE